jgi:hypothetical protein
MTHGALMYIFRRSQLKLDDVLASLIRCYLVLVPRECDRRALPSGHPTHPDAPNLPRAFDTRLTIIDPRTAPPSPLSPRSCRRRPHPHPPPETPPPPPPPPPPRARRRTPPPPSRRRPDQACPQLRFTRRNQSRTPWSAPRAHTAHAPPHVSCGPLTTPAPSRSQREPTMPCVET